MALLKQVSLHRCCRRERLLGLKRSAVPFPAPPHPPIPPTPPRWRSEGVRMGSCQGARCPPTGSPHLGAWPETPQFQVACVCAAILWFCILFLSPSSPPPTPFAVWPMLGSGIWSPPSCILPAPPTLSSPLLSSPRHPTPLPRTQRIRSQDTRRRRGLVPSPVAGGLGQGSRREQQPFRKQTRGRPRHQARALRDRAARRRTQGSELFR